MLLPREGGDDLHIKWVGDPYLLAKGCKFQSLVSLRMFWGKRHYDMVSFRIRSRLGFHAKKYTFNILQIWSLLRGQKILGHTMIALHYGCLTSKPTPSYVRSPPVLQSAFCALISSSSDHPNLPRLPRGISLICQSWGYGIRHFTAAQGLDICIPRGGPWALNTHDFESATDEFIRKDKAFRD